MLGSHGKSCSKVCRVDREVYTIEYQCAVNNELEHSARAKCVGGTDGDTWRPNH